MTEAGEAGTTSAPGTFAPVDEERVLKRSSDGRMLTGVCAGLGRYTGMDPVIFRVGFAALVVGSGIGIMLYIAAILLMRATDGGPGYVEQWTRRLFDADTVLGLLAAVFSFGLIVNLAAGGISTATVIVGTLLAVSLLAAHARGADLLELAKTLPERIKRASVAGAHQPFGSAEAASPAGEYRPFDPRAGAPSAAFTAPAGPGAFSPATGPSTFSPPGAPAHADTSPPVDTPAQAGAPAATGPAMETPRDAETRPFADAGAAPPTSEYRRLSDLIEAAHNRMDSRTPNTRIQDQPERDQGGYGRGPYGPAGFDSSGEPFAPRGPYSRPPGHDPDGSRRAYAPQPYPWRRPGVPEESTAGAASERRPGPRIGGITLLIAFVVGGIMVATQSPPTSASLPLVGGVVLILIGAGLLVATWFGRGTGLVAAGTVVALVLVAAAGTTAATTGLPRNVGTYVWHPMDAAQAVRTYSVDIGDGTLDLGDTLFVPGSRTRFDASVSVGQLKVIVPRSARVEVSGYTRVGEVKIEHKVKGGTDIEHIAVLEPDVTPRGGPPPGGAPVIELHLKAGIGDVEVRRAA
ncbi:PspC domain-containing protein [Sphaerisporangium sp. TRM90804]|nr:PspC domain-containing protein [Sphaerisporangium sp. TRM90804]MDH2423882.1 PspC domain-containing protein [Sphaerisporangium sp. TRM90804]